MVTATKARELTNAYGKGDDSVLQGILNKIYERAKNGHVYYSISLVSGRLAQELRELGYRVDVDTNEWEMTISW